MNRLHLFTEDSDSLISGLTRIIDQGRRDKMQQLSINNFFKQQCFFKRIFNTNSELSQNSTEKQIMPTKTTVN